MITYKPIRIDNELNNEILLELKKPVANETVFEGVIDENFNEFVYVENKQIDDNKFYMVFNKKIYGECVNNSFIDEINQDQECTLNIVFNSRILPQYIQNSQSSIFSIITSSVDQNINIAFKNIPENDFLRNPHRDYDINFEMYSFANNTVVFENLTERSPFSENRIVEGPYYIWDFGDGSPLYSTPSQFVSHSYTNDQLSYDVKLIIEYYIIDDEQTIKINPIPYFQKTIQKNVDIDYITNFNGIDFYLNKDDKSLSFQYNNTRIFAFENIKANNWYSLTYQFKNSNNISNNNIYLYDYSSKTYYSNSQQLNYYIFLNNWPILLAKTFDGSIYKLRLFNKFLEKESIFNLNDNYIDYPNDMSINLRFIEGKGSTIYDYSGHGSDFEIKPEESQSLIEWSDEDLPLE